MARQETNKLRFRWRLGGRTLRPGSYSLSAVPTDRAGNRGPQTTARFRIVCPDTERAAIFGAVGTVIGVAPFFGLRLEAS